jgi:Flp pilus assembly protein TadD
VAVLNEGIGLRPTADLHYHLGVIQMETGRNGDARDNLRKALQLKPDFSEAMDAKQRLKQLETASGK